MRSLPLVVIAVGIASAFVPSSLPSKCVQKGRAGLRPHERGGVAISLPHLLSKHQTRCQAVHSTATVVDDSRRREDESMGKVAVIVCDHGSRRQNANDMLTEVAERFRSFAGFEIVEAAHMELAEPSIEQAFDRCVAAGAQKVVLHPFFLSPGRHVTSDIPTLMKAAGSRHPKVAWVISEPLGLQKLMPRVMQAAISESVEGGGWQYGEEDA